MAPLICTRSSMSSAVNGRVWANAVAGAIAHTPARKSGALPRHFLLLISTSHLRVARILRSESPRRMSSRRWACLASVVALLPYHSNRRAMAG